MPKSISPSLRNNLITYLIETISFGGHTEKPNNAIYRGKQLNYRQQTAYSSRYNDQLKKHRLETNDLPPGIERNDAYITNNKWSVLSLEANKSYR